MKASSTACGVTLSGSLRSVNSGGIFTILEVGAWQLAGTGAVAVPFVENQPRRRHQVEHGGDHAAIKPRRRNLAIFWEAVVILWPQPVNDERIRSRPALHIVVAGASLGSTSAEGWRPGQGQHVKIELARCVLPRILCRRRSGVSNNASNARRNITLVMTTPPLYAFDKRKDPRQNKSRTNFFSLFTPEPPCSGTIGIVTAGTASGLETIAFGA